MKTLVSSTLAALIIAAPAVSFAQQTTHPLTRAEVKAELAQVVAAGYRPAMDHNTYPAAILAAENRVRENAVAQAASSAASSTAPAADTTGYGSEGNSTRASGRALMTNGRDAIYRGH